MSKRFCWGTTVWGRSAEQWGGARGEHLGIRARWWAESRQRRIYCCPSGVGDMESFRSGVVEKKEYVANSSMEKVGYEGRVKVVRKSPCSCQDK